MWVLTGDRKETAQSVGRAAKIIGENDHVIYIAGNSVSKITHELEHSLKFIQQLHVFKI